MIALALATLLARSASADPGGAPSEPGPRPVAVGVSAAVRPLLAPASAAVAGPLASAEPAARIAAARVLSADAAALDLLAAALDRETDAAARRALTDALARLPLTDDQLLAAVRTSEVPTARAYAAHALARLPTDAATAALLAATADSSVVVRTEAYRALGVAGDRVAMNALVTAALREPAPVARAAAATAAEALAGAPTVLPDIGPDLATVRTGHPDARPAAARRLGESGDRRAYEPLLALARSTEPASGQAGVTALGRLGDARAVPSLLALLGTSRGRARYAVLAALAELRDESSADAVTALLRDTDPASRQLAVRALGWIAPDDLFARLAPAATDAVEEVRAEVLQVVARSTSPTRVAALQRALRDASPFVRAEAVRLSADAGMTDRIPALLADPDALVRLAAADALLALRPPGAAEAVRAAAKRARDPEERAQLDEVAARLEGGGLPMPAAPQ
jgi:HEAT repeat protein